MFFWRSFFVLFLNVEKFVGFMVQRIHDAIKSGPFLCASRFHVEVLEAQTRHINNLKSYKLTQQWSDKLAFWKLALIESYRFEIELVG